MSWSSIPHSVKRWQLNSTDYEPPQSQSPRHGTVFSTWTPLSNKANNLQLFEKRVGLVQHWFDLWTDTQRKHLLQSLLSQCTRSQLKYCRDLLIETLPVTRVDFTTVLPRFLSLYVLSFLTPRDLCSAAQVCWNWRILAEQDCLWLSRCVGKGWFLPYTPAEKEYGAWKKHYVSCVSALDWLNPSEAQVYQRRGGAKDQQEEERRKQRRIREIIRERLQQEKSEVLRRRRAWGSSSKSLYTGSIHSRMCLTSLSQSFGSMSHSVLCPGLEEGQRTRTSLEEGQRTRTSLEEGERTRTSLEEGQRTRTGTSLERSDTYCSLRFRRCAASDVSSSKPQTLLLISDSLPAYEMVLSGVKVGVVTVLYNHRHSLGALVAQVERALSGQRVLRLGLLTSGGTEAVHLLQRSELSEQTLLAPELRDFWEQTCSWITQCEEGRGIDIFCPLAASAAGVSLMQSLSALTGLELHAPMGLATGSFQNILGQWCDSSLQQSPSPALHYLHESVLQAWCTQAHWAELCLCELRTSVSKELQRLSAHSKGRAIGYYFQEKICPQTLRMSIALNKALTEGLAAAAAQQETKQLEFLASFLTKHVGVETGPEEAPGTKVTSEGPEDGTLCIPQSSVTVEPHLPLIQDLDSVTFWQRSSADLPLSSGVCAQAALDWRGSVVQELLHSESVYLSRLTAVHTVYQEPLTAAVNSNTAIISIADISLILSPVSRILELNRVLQADLDSRLRQWSAQQCVGDVFVKFCLKLRLYTNYFNNYCTALHTIDKCREMKPLFRAFLRRADRTLATHMLSLQELLLCPLWRIQEYCTLLQALSLHTAPGHVDHAHLSSALSTLRRYKDFLRELKQNSQREKVMEETQQMIHGCPNLIEGNRQLVSTHKCALYRSLDEQLPDSVRALEQVADMGLFLFTDALVLTRLSLHHVPFSVAQSCSYTFVASVALSSLAVRELNHSRYVSNAFVLEGPSRSWVCAADSALERDVFLSVVRTAIETALTGLQ